MRAACSLIALGLVSAAARAGAGEATNQVKQTVDQVLAIVEDPALRGPEHITERRDKMRAVILGRFGFEEMARRSLGPHWDDLNPRERDEYVRLYTDLLERSYIGRVEAYNGEPIQYTGESVEGDRAEVRSLIINQGRTRDRTEISYRLIRSGPKWEVYDLVIDGISTVNNYRVQFGKILRNGTPEDLLRRMRNKARAEEDEESRVREGGKD